MQDVMLEDPDGRGEPGKIRAVFKSDARTEDGMNGASQCPVALDVELADGGRHGIEDREVCTGLQFPLGIKDLKVIVANVQHVPSRSFHQTD